MSSNRGKLVVVSGPSGAGKGTVLCEVLKNPDFVYSISATTRKPREGEINGKNYFFIERDEFEKMIAQNGFIEYAEYNGCLYGTPLEFVNKSLAENKNVILEIEVKGAMQIKKLYPDSVFIFVTPESPIELEMRLRQRGTESPAEIENRMNIAKKELSSAFLYDYVILNEKGLASRAAQDLIAAVRASKLTPFHQYEMLNSYFEYFLK